MPAFLSTFMKWVLLGPHTMNSEDGETYHVNNIKATSQFVSQNIKTVRQTNYHWQKGQPGRAALETPLNVRVGLYIHHATCIKKLVNFLSDLNISDLLINTNYKKVINIKKDVAQAVLKQKEEDNVVFISSNLKREEAVFFAIDNFNLAIDTLDGKKQLHGTGTFVYQEITEAHAVRGFNI